MILPVLDSNHVYHLGDRLIPGVTTILQDIVDYSFIDAHVLAYKADLGTKVHLATEYYDDNILDYENLSSVLRPYVDAWIKFKRDTGFIIELSEHVVYHSWHEYAGTLDRVGILNNDRVLIDIKCVSVLEPHVGVQLAAYFEAENFKRKKADKIIKRFALQLKKDGGYRLKQYRNIEDFRVFTSLLTLYNWRLKHAK